MRRYEIRVAGKLVGHSTAATEEQALEAAAAHITIQEGRWGTAKGYDELMAHFAKVKRQGHQTSADQEEGRRLERAINRNNDGYSVWAWDDVMKAAKIPLRDK